MWFFDAIGNMIRDFFISYTVILVIALAIDIGLAHLVGEAAKRRGREYIPFFVLSLFLGALIGIVVVLLMGNTKQAEENQKIEQGDLKRCPFCAEPINKKAILCKYCGKELRKLNSEKEYGEENVQENSSSAKKNIHEEEVVKTNPENIAGENINSSNHYNVVSTSENITGLDSKKIKREIEMTDKDGNKISGYRTEKKHKKRETTYKYFLSNGERIFNVEDNFIENNFTKAAL